MNKLEAIEQIKKLVEKFNSLPEVERNKYNEEQTKNYFIRPMFEALGWDFSNSAEVSMEETIVHKRADYEFKLNGIPKFYVEAKAIKVDLELEQHARQAINYAWNKGVNWAVLTDFESIKIFNALAHSKFLSDKLVFEIAMADYEFDFDRLWLLSKESFKNNTLDIYAEKYGKKIKSLTVNEKLFGDLKEAREELTLSFKIWNEKVGPITLEEGVQRILDRLVFIRVLEDRGLEQNILKQVVREREAGGTNAQLFPLLIERFKDLDLHYNSNIFKKHACDSWEEHDDKLKRVILSLYGNEVYEYNFKEIPADILGGVYESYLGYIAQKPIEVDKVGKSGQLFKAEDKKENTAKSRQKRKEQGIFYTPKFIVDYIVKNSLGEKLKEIKTVAELKKLKVLDPACGSGSFLTAALQLINEKYKEFGAPGDQRTKTNILLENIYGVDLDSQAIELAKLNLLIGALDKKEKLPDLTGNIRVGNSLISGTSEELKKYFGENYRDKKPFNWQEEFPDVFKQGGFDVIIGNPPWVSVKGKQKSTDFDKLELQYFTEVLHADTYRPNLFEMFIWKSLALLKENAFFSFVVPDRLCANEQFKNIREYILKNCSILNLLFNAEFPGIIGDIVVFVFKKYISKDNIVKIQLYPQLSVDTVVQAHFSESEGKELVYSSSDNEKLLKKIMKTTKSLDSSFKTSVGFIAKSGLLSEEKINNEQIKILKGQNIGRYELKGNYYFDFKKENLAGGTQDKEKLSASPKILMRKTGIDLIAAYDGEGMYPEQSLYFIYGNDEHEILFLLGCLNSRMMNWYYQNFAITNKDSTPQLKKIHLDKFPIPKKNISSDLTQMVKDEIQYKDEMRKISEHSDQWQKLKDEIAKTDKKIDEEVYKLYGLTEEEIKIVEGN